MTAPPRPPRSRPPTAAAPPCRARAARRRSPAPPGRAAPTGPPSRPCRSPRPAAPATAGYGSATRCTAAAPSYPERRVRDGEPAAACAQATYRPRAVRTHFSACRSRRLSRGFARWPWRVLDPVRASGKPTERQAFMDTVNRRQFLQLAGGAGVMSALSPSIARAAAIPANRRTGSLRDVEHIVVLMQENRSFDHYFGTLRGVRGFGDPGYGWTTYPERLERAGVSWKICQDAGDGLDAAGSGGWTADAYIGNYGDNSLLYFNQYRTAAPGNPLYDKARTGTNAKAGEDFFHVLKADVLGGRLPGVSWIVAPEAFTEHPNWPANYGAWYIAQVLDALTADPEVWSRTALLITYDENDGFFDHIVPPYAPPSPAKGRSTVDIAGEVFAGDSRHVPGPYGLGQRVPMLVVSPWSKGGWVCSEVFDHTSIVRLIEKRFGVTEPNISPWRRAVCGDLTAAFDFGRGDVKVPHLPDTRGYVPPDHDRHPDYVPVPPANPALPKQERGLRPARPLPYDLAADGSGTAHGHLRIEFASHGGAGASFQVTSATHPDGPWTYTVGAGRRLSGTWPVDRAAYDITVHGPNGFLRQFTGHAGGAGVEVTARHDEDGERIRLILANPGTRPVRVTVSDGYGSRPATYHVWPGARTVHTAELERSHGWYDLSVAVDDDHLFLRRLTGHVEIGRPSTSDPAIVTA